MAPSKVMVCVTGQKTCDRLIREGARVAAELEGSLCVVHVATADSAYLHSGAAQEAEALEHLFRCAQACGAEISVLRSQDARKTITRFAQEHHITHIVLGVDSGRGGASFADSLSAALPGVHVTPVFDVERG